MILGQHLHNVKLAQTGQLCFILSLKIYESIERYSESLSNNISTAFLSGFYSFHCKTIFLKEKKINVEGKESNYQYLYIINLILTSVFHTCMRSLDGLL